MASWGVTAGLAAMLTCGAASAATLQLEVAGVGEVRAQDVGEAVLLPGNLASLTSVASPILLRAGHRINGMYCHQFGFSFRATNLAAGRSATVQVQIIHPSWTLPDGRSGTQETWTSVLQGDRWGYVGYSFTEAWSLVPGTWSFTISQDGHVLTQQNFQMDVAPGQTMPLQGCVSAVS